MVDEHSDKQLCLSHNSDPDMVRQREQINPEDKTLFCTFSVFRDLMLWFIPFIPQACPTVQTAFQDKNQDMKF